MFGNYSRCAVNVALILLASVAAISAQGVGSSRGLPSASGGTHTIQGHVYFPSGRSAEQGIVVKLESGVVGVRTTVTDGSGTFLFNGLPAAEYTVTVDAGDAYDKLSESVVIYGTSGGVGEPAIGTGMRLDMHLVPKGAAAASEALFAGVPKAAVDSYKKGLQFVSSGDINKAIDQFKQAVSTYPNFGPALNQLAIQYLKLSQADKAAEVEASAVKISPEEFEPHLYYGIALMNLKKFPEAEEQLTAALKANNSSPIGHMYLGIVLMNLHKNEEAQKELEIAAQSSSAEVGQAHRYLGGLYWAKRDYKRAADELETYLKLVPKASDAERTRTAIKELRSKQ